jgi:hypothetical protein
MMHGSTNIKRAKYYTFTVFVIYKINQKIIRILGTEHFHFIYNTASIKQTGGGGCKAPAITAIYPNNSEQRSAGHECRTVTYLDTDSVIAEVSEVKNTHLLTK